MCKSPRHDPERFWSKLSPNSGQTGRYSSCILDLVILVVGCSHYISRTSSSSRMQHHCISAGAAASNGCTLSFTATECSRSLLLSIKLIDTVSVTMTTMMMIVMLMMTLVRCKVELIFAFWLWHILEFYTGCFFSLGLP